MNVILITGSIACGMALFIAAIYGEVYLLQAGTLVMLKVHFTWGTSDLVEYDAEKHNPEKVFAFSAIAEYIMHVGHIRRIQYQ